MIDTILAFLFLGWFFWPITGIFILATYICVVDDKEFEWAPLTWLALVAGFVLMRYPELRTQLFSLKGVAVVLGTYVGAGGLVALWKWLTVLMDFRRLAPAKLAIAKKAGFTDLAANLSSALYGSSYKPLVKEVNGSFYPDSTQFPIATWWTYWPFFLLGVVLDPIARIARRLVDFCKDIYESIAKRFAIKA